MASDDNLELMPFWLNTEIAAERARQDEKWGGPEHDDKHTLLDWADYIWEREQRVRDEDPEARRFLVEIAALAVAAIESIDRLADSNTPGGDA